MLLGNLPLTPERTELCRLENLLPLVAAHASTSAVHNPEVHLHTANELARQRHLESVLPALADAGFDFLIFKGAALAALLYEQPWHRVRSDTDVLVKEADFPAISRELVAMGFTPNSQLPGDYVMGEQAFSRRDEFGLSHTLDVHFRLNNNWQLAGVLDFKQLWRDRLPLLWLGERIWTCSYEHALLIACVHRAAHASTQAYQLKDFVRQESDFTLWIYDIHLLSQRLEDEQWRTVVEVSVGSGTARLIANGLERSCLLFDSSIPEGILQTLRQAEGQVEFEVFSRALTADLQSFKKINGTQGKLAYLRQHLLPDRQYMEHRYGSTGWLGMSYAARLFRGLANRL